MASLDQVLSDMQAHGLPPLPPGHPICDGKEHRFGPRKKAWYKLHEIKAKAGQRHVYGVFGYWRADDNGAIGVSLSDDEVSKEELAAARKRQEDSARREAERKEEQARWAANRARQQWDAAAPDGASAYLDRKCITAEAVRFDKDGMLLVPMVRYRADGYVLAGLQKIAPDGEKRFNQGMEKVGAACKLGRIAPDEPLIGIGEGYATLRSVRMGMEEQFPAVVAFDAGNLLAVAQALRASHPHAHLLFFADDDYQLEQRLARRLADEFKVFEPIDVDGRDIELASTDGTPVQILATWREDTCGIRYIAVDIRSGGRVRTLKFENAGMAKAFKAAKVVGNASVVWPTFADRGDNKWTDFNDLHVQESLDAVRQQISVAVEAALAVPVTAIEEAVEEAAAAPPAPTGDEPPIDLPPAPSDDQNSPPPLKEWASSKVAAVDKPTLELLLEHFCLVYGSTDVWDGLNLTRIKRAPFIAAVGKELAAQWLDHEKRRNINAESLPVLRRGRAVDGGAGDRLGEMLKRLTLLYGTEAVWDSEKRVLLSLGAVRAAYGGDMVKRWQEHALRRMIDAENLVFDPRQQADPKTHINMYHGLPLTPKDDEVKAQAVLDLLFDLCSAEANSEEIGQWLIKWLAYPLQHPGAKMQTAVLMFGEKQGTGKSLFFEGIVRPIYGDYGGTAGQHQLDSGFTDWKSRKVFMLFEEVLSRDDRYSHIGTLKHMITGRDMRINPKNLPERVEANHLNSVFLSNESQPIPIELEDRRFMVIEAKNKLTEARVDEIKELMKGGLSAAFYHFLLHYPLGNFDEHTKPLMTEAKRKIIRFGRPGWDAFHEAWKEGELQAPYCSCLSEDLYTVYCRWCERNHEKRLTMTKFSELLSGRERKDKKWVQVGSQPKKTKMVFLIDDGEEGDLNKKVQKFRDLAEIKTDI